jgi:hypothetical protein
MTKLSTILSVWLLILIRTLVVGFQNCNSTGGGSHRGYLGEMYDNLILVDYCVANTATCVSPNSKVMLFEKVDDHWDPRQSLGYQTSISNDDSISSFAVDDETIVLGVSSYDITYPAIVDDVGAVYVLEPGLHKGKPQPRQWSIQQLLFSDAPTASESFGKDVSIVGNTMIVSDANAAALFYVFERQTEHGKWS